MWGDTNSWADVFVRDLRTGRRIVRTKRELEPWVTLGVAYARSLPAKG